MSFIMLLFSSCASFDEELSLGTHRITYIVNTESGTWFGSYIDKHGEVVSLQDRPFQLGEWTYSFVSDEIPGELFIEASSEFYDDDSVEDKPDVTTSIFIDGDLIDIQTNSIADGKTATGNPSLSI